MTARRLCQPLFLHSRQKPLRCAKEPFRSAPFYFLNAISARRPAGRRLFPGTRSLFAVSQRVSPSCGQTTTKPCACFCASFCATSATARICATP